MVLPFDDRSPDCTAANESMEPIASGPGLTTTVAVWLLMAVSVACAAPAQRMDLVIEGATVIDPEARAVLTAHSIAVRRGRIHSVEPSRAHSLTARQTIDATGTWIMPGLLDMHVHLTKKEIRAHPDLTLQLLLANGITGVRDMAGDCWEPRGATALCRDDLRRLARRIDGGKVNGPRLLALSSAPVHGVWERDRLPDGAAPWQAPETADEARRLVRYLARRRVDLVKIYNTVPRDTYFALAAAAGARGLEVSGHLPLGVSVVEASDAGHRTLEHARDLPIACSPYSAEYRNIMHLVIEGESGPDPPDAGERMTATLDGYDEGLCRGVLRRLEANGTHLVPSHGTRELDARGGEAEYRDDARMRYVAPALVDDWNEELDPTAEAAPRFGELYTRLYELGIRITGMAIEEGVSVMVGTDANDTMIFPGFAIHDELERFALGGVAPMEILRAATTVPAGYLGRADLGGIGPGKLADLVVLRANPLADISNSRKIEAVVVGGHVYNRGDLDAMLDDVERRVADLRRAMIGDSPNQKPEA
ncbi:MAG: amidohydrolase family protein [Acidobacteriota bacterium]|nr:amidohydrolase family protein [Acidobacteriota bacterium]